ncbi:CocE/NonD family hydrolase C-terminal non-catalytic domain-containing protein [Streptomyces sp. NPDC007901]|uniref:CocE/NonD family hydrolase C-terminal non-catalytic domain-containing protein n=1 Tax=Streptomyces sp. NPDC007901 TaxID=3364785 RepID=UPI0036E47950
MNTYELRPHEPIAYHRRSPVADRRLPAWSARPDGRGGARGLPRLHNRTAHRGRQGDRPCGAVSDTGEHAEHVVDLWSTSIVFRAGHRIRLQVTCSNFPR